MASTRIIEEEHDTYTDAFVCRHNGYWAGDFADRSATASPTRPRSRVALAAA